MGEEQVAALASLAAFTAVRSGDPEMKNSDTVKLGLENHLTHVRY